MHQAIFKKNIIPLKDKLYRFAYRFMQNGDDAMDVVKDVYVKLWNQKKELLKIENPEAFAMRMTRNMCLDKLKAKRTFSIDDQFHEPVSDTEEQANDKYAGITPEKIRNLVHELPIQQKEIMLLKDFEAYDYEEIASITQLSINTIRVNLSRARKKIREKLLKEKGTRYAGN